MQHPKTLYPPAIPQEGFGLQSLEGPEVPGGPEPLPTVGMMVVVGRGVCWPWGLGSCPTHWVPLSTANANLHYQTPGSDQDVLPAPPAGTSIPEPCYEQAPHSPKMRP